jgi:hypothetical protein
MKALFFSKNAHAKNLHFIKKCKKIEFTIYERVNQFNNYKNIDFVYSISEEKQISRYPNTKFIFGPQFSVFPDNTNSQISRIKHSNGVYNGLSDWVIDCWKEFPIVDGLRFVKLPFGVDTEIFDEIKPITKREKVFIYFKERDPNDLAFVENELAKRNISYKIFNYNTRYEEKDYIDYLHESKYGIWIGRHESQGFALQEALSSNVPLLVWDVRYMSQQHENMHIDKDYPATSIPYWHEKCGEFFHDKSDFLKTYSIFLEKIGKYNPREFIVENLSVEACENRIIDFVENMKI